tara:strand:- start:420 stop:710 length:291 start_codon:yes stop_codon:yes gene_type:complete
MDKNKIDFADLQRSIEDLKLKTVQESDSFEDKVIYLLEKLMFMNIKTSSSQNETLKLVNIIQRLIGELATKNVEFKDDSEKRIKELELRIKKLEDK